jgi:ribosomal protein S18 acetylase RimI-like enzyme
MRDVIHPRDVTLREDVRPDDLASVRQLTTSTGFFRPDEVEIATELVAERLHRGPRSGYEFVLADGGARLVGYACYGRVPCSTVSWELYWIAVHPTLQGTGLGHRLLVTVERRACEGGGLALYAETSGRSLYRPTRGFYRRNGYEEVATLPDFYAIDDDKVVFAKTLVG